MASGTSQPAPIGQRALKILHREPLVGGKMLHRELLVGVNMLHRELIVGVIMLLQVLTLSSGCHRSAMSGVYVRMLNAPWCNQTPPGREAKSASKCIFFSCRPCWFRVLHAHGAVGGTDCRCQARKLYSERPLGIFPLSEMMALWLIFDPAVPPT